MLPNFRSLQEITDGLRTLALRCSLEYWVDERIAAMYPLSKVSSKSGMEALLLSNKNACLDL